MTSSDDRIRLSVADVPVPHFDRVAAMAAPPLSESRVAIVTTAGFTPANRRELWPVSDPAFNVFDAHDRELHLAHFSPNFDRSGVATDLNVVYPIDRLFELAERGVIGSVASQHLSFMGAQIDLNGIRFDTAPRAAQLLLDDDVDVVLLTPI